MDDDQKEQLRDRNRRRAWACQRCSSYSVLDRDGAQLDRDSHFPGVIYRVCQACGFEAVLQPRRRRPTRPKFPRSS